MRRDISLLLAFVLTFIVVSPLSLSYSKDPARTPRSALSTSCGVSNSSEPPALLSQTNIFQDLENLTPNENFIEYETRVSFWSDGAAKKRWICLPNGVKSRSVGFSANGPWDFPVGSVLVKHFELAQDASGEGIRVETRVFVHAEDGAWRGYTYQWTNEQNDTDLNTSLDANLLEDGASKEFVVFDPEAPGGTRNQTWTYPSRSECLTCHNDVSGFVLGVRTEQLNFVSSASLGEVNQLEEWNRLEIFQNDIGDVQQYDSYANLDDLNESFDVRARSYLAVNCSNCHQPGSDVPTPIDLRFEVSLEEMGVVDVFPYAGDLGIEDARIVKPGEHEKSVLWKRMEISGPGRMPPISSHEQDHQGLEIIRRWIDGLEAR